MKKSLLFILFVFICAGCDIKYNLEIKGNTYETSLNVKSVNNQENMNSLNNITEYVYPNLKEDYEFKDNTTESQIDVTFDNEMSLNQFRNSNELNEYFETKSILEDEKYIYIYMDTFIFNQTVPINYNVDNFSFNITTNHKVLEHNAQKVEGTTYTWEGNEETFPEINFVYYKNETVDGEDIDTEPEEETVEQSQITTITMIIGGIIVFIVFVLAVINIRRNRF